MGNFVITQLDKGICKSNFLTNEDCEGVVILSKYTNSFQCSNPSGSIEKETK